MTSELFVPESQLSFCKGEAYVVRSEQRWGGPAEESQHDWQVAGATQLHVTHSNKALGEFAIVLWKDLTASEGGRWDIVAI